MPVVLAVLGGVVLYMALQIHKYTTKDPVKRAQLKPLDPQKAFGTLVACKALDLRARRWPVGTVGRSS